MIRPTLILLLKFDKFLKKYKTSQAFFRFNMTLLGTLVNFNVRFYWLRHPLRQRYFRRSEILKQKNEKKIAKETEKYFRKYEKNEKKRM